MSEREMYSDKMPGDARESREFPIEFSASLGELATALAVAQGELQNATKDKSNPAFKGTTYATLAALRDAVTPALSKNGLSIVQLNEPHGKEGVCVVTILLHKSGQWMRSRLFIPATKQDAQGFGSAITYGRRYALSAICNIASEDDDDGNAAAAPPQRKAEQSRKDADPKPQKEAIDKFIALIKKCEDMESLAAVGIEVKKAKLSDNDQAVVRLAWADRSKELGG